VKTDDGSEKYIIIEVKGDNKIDDEVVKAKADYASQLAGASGMTYKIIKGSEASKGIIVS
jgi:type III restriction enzyme